MRAGLPPVALALLVSGCTVTPQQLAPAERQMLMQTDREQMFAEVVPIEDPITLEEAIARALKYNLDARLTLMEQALESNQLHLARFDMLPGLAANAGYSARSNDALHVSQDVNTGQISQDPSRSQDSAQGYANLTLSWNLLDFGVSYYQAHQYADQYLIAQERRRRAINQVVQQVRNAYWRAATAAPLYEQVAPLIDDARAALRDAREVETQRLSSPLETLQYQKGLVEIIRELEILETDLAVARSELASLMGLPPGTHFQLARIDRDDLEVPQVQLELEQMEELALLNRPEIIESHYQQRISALEVRKALLQRFPSLGVESSYNYDSNSFVVNQTWADIGANLSWNLVNLASARATRRQMELREDIVEMQRLSLSMAALTQVNVSYQHYIRARRAFEQAQLLDEIEARIYDHVRIAAESEAQSALQRIRAEMSAVYAEVNSLRAYADVHGAVANLYVSLGIDPLPETVESHDLASLTASIRDVLQDWSRGDLRQLEQL